HSQVLLDKVKVWTKKVAQVDVSKQMQLIEALKTVFHKLQTYPTRWGEPERTLPGQKLNVYHGVHSILSVYYIVLEEQRTVVLQDLKLVPSFLLESGLDENA